VSGEAGEVKRLRWRCRRGVRELDILLTRFLDERFERLDAEGRESFAALLECQDPDVVDWLMGRRADYPASCERAVRLLLESS
jgi:antitoxin CptB